MCCGKENCPISLENVFAALALKQVELFQASAGSKRFSAVSAYVLVSLRHQAEGIKQGVPLGDRPELFGVVSAYLPELTAFDRD